MADDVILNKAASIERCLRRVEEEHADNEQNLVGNQSKQDAIVLNLQRACETAIDLAMYVVSPRKLGVPQDSRDAFILLQTAGILPADLATRMQKMVGFRDVHEYTRLNLKIIHSIITKQLDDFRTFSDDREDLRLTVTSENRSSSRANQKHRSSAFNILLPSDDSLAH